MARKAWGVATASAVLTASLLGYVQTGHWVWLVVFLTTACVTYVVATSA